MMPETTTTKERFLSERHRKMLEEESRIAPEVIEARGYWTAESIEELTSDPGIKANQLHAPALVLPIFGIDGAYKYSRVKPDEAPAAPRGKYLQPAGTPNVLDVPRTVLNKVTDGLDPLAITEGEKKADYLASLGVPVIGLFGVWTWSHKVDEGTPYEKQLLLPDFDLVRLRDRRICILFDCDTATNANIQLAAHRLAQRFMERGARLW